MAHIVLLCPACPHLLPEFLYIQELIQSVTGTGLDFRNSISLFLWIYCLNVFGGLVLVNFSSKNLPHSFCW